MRFARALVSWYEKNARDLPWRRTRDPYRIWLSEVMLQQTRVQAVIPYYAKFLDQFPTVHSLAAAPEQQLLACWSGLGYYSRARNMQKAAAQVASVGGFPRDYASIRTLPGIGPYTAAAIASIAFELPHAVLDGNVLRVMARLANDASDIGAPRTRARLQDAAQELLDRRHPGRFNQALMELGATVCLPREPLCRACPVTNFCQAWKQGTAAQLPVKLRKAENYAVQTTVLLVRKNQKLLMWQRGGEATRMRGFWELPESNHLPDAVIYHNLGTFRHSITNHRYLVSVAVARVSKIPRGFRWVSPRELERAPVSTMVRKALRLSAPK